MNSKRHLVLLSFSAIFLSGSVLIFPQYFIQLLIVGCIISALFLVVFIKRRQIVTGLIFTAVIIISVLNPYRVYVTEELYAQNAIADCQGEKTTFAAIVDDCKHYSGYSVIYADIKIIGTKKLDSPIRARISSYTAGGIYDGNKIIFSGIPQSYFLADSQDFDTASYLRSKKAFVDITSAEILSSAPGENGFLSQVRKFTKGHLYSYIPQDHNFVSANVCYAMFAGDRDYVNTEIITDFRECGLSHILCVSGMHLAIIMGFFYSVFSAFTVHKKLRCIFVIILCFIYCFFTGLSLSTLRACFMCAISFAAMMTGRKADSYISLFVSLLIICLISPYGIFDISLILSAASSFGIITFGMIIATPSGCGFIKKSIYSLLNTFAANLGAVLFTLPIVCYSFGGISHLSVIATMLVMIPCEILLMLILLLFLLVPFSYIGFLEPILSIIGYLCDKLTLLIISIAEFLSDLKYSYTPTDKNQAAVYVLIFAGLVIAISFFVYLGKTKAVVYSCIPIIILGIVISVSSLYFAIIDDGIYKVSYFRQNENDRQLSVKLPHDGYLIVNADSTLCMIRNKADFDDKRGQNYLLLIPDNQISASVLASEIEIFDERFGIKKIFVPKTNDGAELAKQLHSNGIDCSFMPDKSSFGEADILFSDETITKLTINDNDVTTEIVYADSYDRNCFSKECDVAAFFTRKTKNNFDPEKDTPPDCSTFYTRMKRGVTADKIINTIDKKNFMIKE